MQNSRQAKPGASQLLNGTRRTNESGVPKRGASDYHRTGPPDEQEQVPNRGASDYHRTGPRGRNENGLQPSASFRFGGTSNKVRGMALMTISTAFSDPKRTSVFGILSRYSSRLGKIPKTKPTIRDRGKAGRRGKPKTCHPTANKPKHRRQKDRPPPNPGGYGPFPPYACQAPNGASEPVPVDRLAACG